ncbi:50S ribosomal protein L1, partial [candidate division WWE3 bacterium]|nr:50S ribosomal protein L1 [candidate division WWE3 bacterium]
QSFRTTVSLPHGTGRQLRVATFSTEKVDNADMQLTDSDLDKIVAGSIAPKRDFDILVSEPSLMPKLAKVARVLGPAGVMPNPKNGTVAADVKNAVEQIKKGKIEIRTEQNFPIMHSILGKKSFGVKKLTENFEELWTTLKASKPAKAKPDWIKDCYITSSMGQSYQVDITTL